jgi:hypothetical protein
LIQIAETSSGNRDEFNQPRQRDITRLFHVTLSSVITVDDEAVYQALKSGCPSTQA